MKGTLRPRIRKIGLRANTMAMASNGPPLRRFFNFDNEFLKEDQMIKTLLSSHSLED